MPAERAGLSALLLAAVKAGRLAEVTHLLEAGADVDVASDPDNSTPLHIAAQQSQKAVVQRLISYRADVDAADKRGYTALHLAARKRSAASWSTCWLQDPRLMQLAQMARRRCLWQPW